MDDFRLGRGKGLREDRSCDVQVGSGGVREAVGGGWVLGEGTVWAWVVEFRVDEMMVVDPLMDSREGWTTDGGHDDSRDGGDSGGADYGNILDFYPCSCRIFGGPSVVCRNERRGWPL